MTLAPNVQMRNTTVYINGKFLVQRTTGVQRFARGIVQALDEILESVPISDRPSFVLLTPRSSPALGLRAIPQREIGPWRINLHLWEQLVLPWTARNGTLLCLSGSASLLHRRQVATIHDAAIFEHPEAYTKLFIAWYRLLFRACARLSPLLLTTSDFSRQRLARHLPRKGPTVIIPAAADHIEQLDAEPRGIDRLGLRRQRYWLAVGSANPTKNFARLVEAFCELPESLGIQLVVVGGRNSGVFSGSSSNPMRDDERLIWTGPIADAGLRSLYDHALGFVFPSFYEGFGLPPLEAMMCGCPVAAARAAAIPEVCADAVLYFDPLSTDSIREALHRLSVDEDLQAQLAQRGKLRAATFSWKASAALLLRHLHDHDLLARANP